MKKIILWAILLTTAFPKLGQAQQCTCGEDIQKIAYSKYHLTQSSDVASFLSIFFNMTEEQRSMFIQNTTSNTGLEALTKDMYLNYTNDETSQTTKEDFKKLQEQFRQNQSFTQNDLINIYKEVVSPDALKTYNECMKTCYGGIRIFIDGNESDEFVATVKWTPRSAAEMNLTKNITVNFTGLNPINSATIYDGASLSAGYSLSQTYKRKDPFSVATLVITVSGIGQDSHDFVAKDKEVPGETPIGTIIASTLNYDKFLSLYSKNDYDAKKTKWAPCDGRNVSGSKYSQEISPTTPDFRGKFLRCVNQIWATNEPALKPEQSNPENKTVGEYQDDALQSHTHKVDKAGTNVPDSGRLASGNSNYPNGTVDTGGAEGGKISNETRPKNISVYYYIRIN